MSLDAFLLLAPLLPIFFALALMWRNIPELTLSFAPWMALPGLIMALTMTPGTTLELPWILLGSSLGIDETGRVYLLFTSLLWLLAGVYATGYIQSRIARVRFFIWYLFAMTGNFGLILAQDLALYYTFFAMMSFASFGLVVFEGTPESLRAGRIYIILVVIGEALLFAGFVLAAWTTGGQIEFVNLRPLLAESVMQDWVFGLVLLGFGIKAGVIGLHFWLPLAHPVAPTPASAVLSGAMIAAGLLGWIRVLPLGQAIFSGWGEAIIMAGMASVIYASLIGCLQHNAKTVLAYSSIAKMGIMTSGVGLGMLVPESWPLMLTAILIFALHHALAKGGLFLGVGMAVVAPGSKLQRRLIIAGLSILVLALAGAPLSSGMFAKQLFKFSLTSAPQALLDWAGVLLTVSSVTTTLLMVRFLYLVWPQREIMVNNTGRPLAMWWSWLSLIAGVIFLPVYILLYEGNLQWSPKMLFDALWPIVSGGLISILVWLTLRHRTMNKRFNIPPGDIVVIFENVIYPLLTTSLSFIYVTFSNLMSSLNTMATGWRGKEFLSAVADSCENQLARWNLAMTLLLATGLLVVFLLII